MSIYNGEFLLVEQGSELFAKEVFAGVPTHPPEGLVVQARISFDAKPYGDDSVMSYQKGNVGFIAISGMIVTSAPRYAAMYGVAPLNVIREEMQAMDNDPDITKIVPVYNSGGGVGVALDSMFEFMNNLKTPVHGFVEGSCCSAMYFLASSNTEIVSAPTGRIGSIGTMIEFYNSSDSEVITSTNSPAKNSLAIENRPQLIEMLNGMTDIFAGYVALGRSTTPENVLENFGKGGVFLAEKAVSLGMIDKVMTMPVFLEYITGNEKPNENGSNNNNEEDVRMETLAELSAAHPSLVQQAQDQAVDNYKAEQKLIKQKDELRCTALDDLGKDAKELVSAKMHSAVDKIVAQAKTEGKVASSFSGEFYKQVCSLGKDDEETPTPVGAGGGSNELNQLANDLGQSDPNSNFQRMNNGGEDEFSMSSSLDNLEKLGVSVA